MVIKRKTKTTAAYYRYKKAIKHSAKRQGSHLLATAECADGDLREFDLETRVITNENIIILEMFHSCALNK